MKLIFSEKCLEYSQLGHPESPGRVKKAYDFLRDKYDFLEPKPAFEEDLLRVHSKDWVEIVKTRSFFDFDSPAYKNVYEYARLSAGGAILAAKEKGFSLMRPPGHHAGRSGRALGVSSLGFCYFNNIAIAVRTLGLSTLILDIDGHHGNGTQEIFSGDPKVIYVSLHRYPYYPGTGYVSETNCLNYPLPSICGDELYLETLDEALGKVDMKNIDLIAISAGFDAHQGDLASLGLSSKCYREIGKKIGALKKPAFGVLEGGYVGENVGKRFARTYPRIGAKESWVRDLKVVYHERYAEVYSSDPASKLGRMESIYSELYRKFEFIKPEAASENDLKLVHTKAHINSIKEYELIYEIARLAAGGAIRASEIAIAGEPAFGLIRPPGHHASPNRCWGFCFFNNIAISIEKLRREGKIKRALIVDIDLHYGDGTANIFSSKPEISYFHIPGEDREEQLKELSNYLIGKKNYDIIAVSAGFDRHVEDWGGMLHTDDYRTIGALVKEFAEKNCDGRRYGVLEGGYNHEVLGKNVRAFLEGME